MSSSVPLDSVIAVLERVKDDVDISLLVDGHTITIFKNGEPESYDFPERKVSQKILHRMQVKYNIRIEFFYRPEMISISSNTIQ